MDYPYNVLKLHAMMCWYPVLIFKKTQQIKNKVSLVHWIILLVWVTVWNYVLL